MSQFFKTEKKLMPKKIPIKSTGTRKGGKKISHLNHFEPQHAYIYYSKRSQLGLGPS